MIFTWNCKRCNAEYQTACYEFVRHKGELIIAYTLEEHRRRRASHLCTVCWDKFKKNSDPVFDLLFKLQEKQSELNIAVQELDNIYQGRIEQTPERIAALAEGAQDKGAVGFGFIQRPEEKI